MHSPQPHRARYDVVLYGASGFVGRQTVRYFAHSDAVKNHRLRWALAGRNKSKLEKIRADTAGAADAGIVVAAADDLQALDELAKGSGVVLSTAGPFALYGGALMAACVRHGTHYVDITGETPWAAAMIAQHHATAAKTGTRIIPFCGFDSVPSDLGALLMTQAMQERRKTVCVKVTAAFSLRGGINGGTLASLFNIMGSDQTGQLSDLYLLNPPATRPAVQLQDADPISPRYDPHFEAWLGPFFMSVINTRVVRRSAALLGYGPDFRYQEYLRLGKGVTAGISAALLGAGTGLLKAALGFSAVRRAASALLPKAGQGPSEASMNNGSYRCELMGQGADGRFLHGTVADHGDPGNRATTKMVCESALCLAIDFDQLPGGAGYGGVLTPASGLGNPLINRLRAVGMTLVVD